MIVMNVFVAAVVVMIAIAGCAPRRSVPPPDVVLLSPEQVLEKIFKRSRGLKGVKGTAKISVDAPNGRYVRNVAIVVKQPDSLRVDALPYFGTPDFFLSVNDGILKVFLPGEDHFYIGKSSRENIYSFFHIMLDGDDIVPLLTGALPPDITISRDLRGSMTENGYCIDSVRDGIVTSSLIVGLEDTTIRRISRYERNELIYSVTFDDYRTLGDTAVPYRIDIDMKKPRKVHASIRYSRLQPTGNDREGLFDLPVPQGVQPLIIE
jgi:hypothetical protein